MITKLELTNFRSHKHTIINLCSGINVFVGRGQAGKTNIKRALEWLCFNRPSGDKVHSQWCVKGDATIVRATTDDRYTVTIKKTIGGGVEYYLDTPEGKKETFRKVGRNVPDRITQILRIDDINIQSQIDQPFLVTDSTGEISRKINEIIDLEIADQWLKELNARKSSNNASIAVLEEKFVEAKSTMEAFAGLDKIGKLLKIATSMQGTLSDKESRLMAVDRYLDTTRLANRRVSEAETIIQINPLLEKGFSILDNIERKEATVRSLDRFMDLCVAADETVRRYEKGRRDYTEELRKAGVCPFCLREMTGKELDAVAAKI